MAKTAAEKRHGAFALLETTLANQRGSALELVLSDRRAAAHRQRVDAATLRIVLELRG